MRTHPNPHLAANLAQGRPRWLAETSAAVRNSHARVVRGLVCLVVLVALGGVSAQVPSNQVTGRLGVAVQQFRVDDLRRDGLSEELKEAWGRSMAGKLEGSLHASGRFEIETRLDLDEVLEEARLCGEGFTGPESECVIDLSMVHVLILGTIDILSDDHIDVAIRFIDSSSGNLLHTFTESGSGPADFEEIADRLAEEAVRRFPLTGKIIQISGGVVWTDLGTKVGLSGQPVTGYIFRFNPVANTLAPENIGTFRTTVINPEQTAIEVDLQDGYELQLTDVVTVSEVEQGIQSPSSPAQRGTVVIEAAPEGAAVYVGDERVGVIADGRLELALDQGTHDLRVEAEGYGTVTRTVEATSAQVRVLALTLPRLAGRLHVRTEPPGARVLIDGLAIDTTPVSIASQPTGRYQVRLEAEGYEPHDAEVQVEAGQTATVFVELTPILGSLELRVDATEYRVSIDGEDRGMAGELELAPGTYEVAIAAPGRTTHVALQRIDAGATAVHDVSLPWAPNLSVVAPQGTKVSVRSDPGSDVEVLSPVADMAAEYGLPPGRYSVVLTAPNGAEHERLVVLAGSQLAELVFPGFVTIDAPDDAEIVIVDHAQRVVYRGRAGQAIELPPGSYQVGPAGTGPETAVDVRMAERVTVALPVAVAEPPAPDPPNAPDAPEQDSVEEPVAVGEAGAEAQDGATEAAANETSMRPEHGMLRVSSNVPGATVDLQGLEPLQFGIDGLEATLEVPRGLYFWTATAPGARSIDDALSIAVGETTEVALSFELAPVMLRIGSIVDDGTARVLAQFDGNPSETYVLRVTGPAAWNGGASAETELVGADSYLWVSEEALVPGSYEFILTGASLDGYAELSGAFTLDSKAVATAPELFVETSGTDLSATWPVHAEVELYLASVSSSHPMQGSLQSFEAGANDAGQLTFSRSDLRAGTSYVVCVAAIDAVEDLGIVQRVAAARACEDIRTPSVASPAQRAGDENTGGPIKPVNPCPADPFCHD